MIKNKFKYALLTLLMLAGLACSPMKSDAKKAASLINKSIEHTEAVKLDKAEKTYLQAQDIINKYKEKNKAEEFYELFIVFRDK